VKNKALRRAVLLIIIALLITGGWLMKNYVKKDRSTVESDVAISDNSDFDLNITTAIDIQKLLAYGLPIIIDFGADSCIPCKEMAPVLKELNATLRGKVIIKFVDVWKYQALSEGYPISIIPTQVFIGADGRPFTPADTEALSMDKYYSKSTGEHTFTTHEGGLSKSQLLSILKEMGVTI
jgi:thioredoxin 1